MYVSYQANGFTHNESWNILYENQSQQSIGHWKEYIIQSLIKVY